MACPREITLWSEQQPGLGRARERRRGALSRPERARIRAGCWAKSIWPAKPRCWMFPWAAGHIVLFGMRPQYRGQSYQNFKLLFNALIYR